MSQMTPGRDAGVAPGVRQNEQAAQHQSAIAQGAGILTLDGLLPVEFLNPGDRIVTRAGAMQLRAVHVRPPKGQLIRVAPSALGHDRPGQALLLAPETEVLVRDWRATVMFGKPQAMVAVSRLIDGDYVARVGKARTRLYTLEFDSPQVVYADGVEVGCAAVRAEVVTAAA
ncbi:Hint domain-containing protein [Phaeovulum sp.]|uniref:Hint domain-containing protein n=1 Tax=Phaeovulum sp. TaxID=2934796 RepID=UPI002731F9EC|nr:Hint domain-containing protein [Phaeovulum sp.]MDP1670260.1 Hint domain-containing protein [Phaeovulum sp.]MDZ4120244.1 Hint domain-containing protein [Phaeovulum sp.]